MAALATTGPVTSLISSDKQIAEQVSAIFVTVFAENFGSDFSSTFCPADALCDAEDDEDDMLERSSVPVRRTSWFRLVLKSRSFAPDASSSR
jgi:hypothetical protein